MASGARPARRPAPRPVARPASQRSAAPGRVAAVVTVVGVLITAAVSGTAWTLNRNNERNLLRVQTRQAAAVLAAQILGLSDPLSTALQLELATDGDPIGFRAATADLTGPDRLFVRTELFDVTGARPRSLAAVGEPALVGPDSAELAELLAKARLSPTFVVRGVGSSRMERVAYAVADPRDPRLAVYAERAIPANRRVPVESNPAFEDLHFATYLGPAADDGALATTDLAPSQLPMSGDVETARIPFGDTTLTLVASARGQLGGPLGRQRPWILLVGGLLLTAVTAVTGLRFARRRREAEQSAATIAELYTELDRLYAEQRGVSETLQHALLPRATPRIHGLEIATRYMAGTGGIEIGGDWYSVVAVDGARFGFVVGDVSGRGVSAATVMARLRFTLRAYLLEGHPPHVALDMCARHIDFLVDGHFATALVGLGDLDTREVVLANAGHLAPLIVHGSGAHYVTTSVGTPLGVQLGSYLPTTVRMPPGSTLVAFTDGLVERRGESIDDGLHRLAEAAGTSADTLDGFVAELVSRTTQDTSEDDVAVLAFRWLDASGDGRAPIAGPATDS